MVRMRNDSQEDAVQMLGKAKELMESATEMMETACDMLKQSMSKRSGMGYRNNIDERNMSRDSRGRFSGRNWDEDERMMRRDDGWDDMPRGRFGY